MRGLVPGYEDFANADLIVSTDCHNPKSDYDSDGCFGDLLDKNTGVMAIRATPNGIASMAEWRVRLAMGLKDEQDQTTFMDLIDGNGRGHRWGMTPATRAAFKVTPNPNPTANPNPAANPSSNPNPNPNPNLNPNPNPYPNPNPNRPRSSRGASAARPASTAPPTSRASPAGSAARLRTRRGHGASTTCACPM